VSREREALAKELFAGALDLPPSERERYLRDKCADESMRAELCSLLGHHETAGAEFLERDAIPAQIGPYRIVRQVGEGGFGAVFEAMQERPVQRRVAIKVLRAGMDTREIVQRFAAERQALALMTHPGIARVFDAGTTERGRPYVAMEYVGGAAINRYCDENRLETGARLRLFADVCLAVQHAHQKSVIHRDLKPSNILVETVDGKPVPKIIDFGIAKALDEGPGQPLVTRRGQLIGTPGYMSPEQVRGLDIDTRADIYALGAVLYELLTGSPPFDPYALAKASPAELERMLTDVEPPAPSTRVRTVREPETKTPHPDTLSLALRGDLDAIVLKAMDSVRDRRYESTGALAADVQRYLANEPILARPTSRAYRMRKFAKRHRAMVLAMSGIGAALVVGLSAAVYGLIQASRERDQARLETRVLAGVVGFVNNDLLRAADPRNAQGRDVTVKDALAAAASGIEGKFGEDPLVEAAIRLTVGEIERTLGRNDEAVPQIERAIAIRTERLGAGHADTLTAVRELGVVKDDSGKSEEAVVLFARVLDGRWRLLGESDPLTVQALNDLGVAESRVGRFVDSEAHFRSAIEVRTRTLGPDDPDTLLAMNNLATALLALDRHDEMYELAKKASAGWVKAAGADDRVTLDCRNTLGLAALRLGRLDEAEDVFRDTLDRRTKVLKDEHLAVADSLCNLGECLCARAAEKPGAAIEAEGLLRRALAVRESRRPPGDWATAIARSMLGDSLLLQGRFEEAEPLVIAGYEGVTASAWARPERKRWAGARVVELYRAWGKTEKAEEWQRRISGR
jgi:non-specific serine/threonine protein kinase/serine/threonine-protein kinase